jgi:hypothetical protein
MFPPFSSLPPLISPNWSSRHFDGRLAGGRAAGARAAGGYDKYLWLWLCDGSDETMTMEIED